MFGKVNVNGGLNRWLRSLRDHNHLAKVGSLQPVKGSLAPLTRP